MRRYVFFWMFILIWARLVVVVGILVEKKKRKDKSSMAFSQTRRLCARIEDSSVPRQGGGKGRER